MPCHCARQARSTASRCKGYSRSKRCSGGSISTPLALEEAVRLAGTRGDVRDWLVNPPQTNETMRSTVLVAGFLEIARARIRAAVASAGSRATPDAGLAHLSLETSADTDSLSLELTLWPGGEHRQLARSHPHGRWVKWLV